jgi:hypothetical protein
MYSVLNKYLTSIGELSQVTVKPKPNGKQNADVDSLIRRGGSAPDSEDIEGVQLVNLKIPKKVLRKIDEIVSQREIEIPRTLWLMEAIHEKIKREQS